MFQHYERVTECWGPGNSCRRKQLVNKWTWKLGCCTKGVQAGVTVMNIVGEKQRRHDVRTGGRQMEWSYISGRDGSVQKKSVRLQSGCTHYSFSSTDSGGFDQAPALAPAAVVPGLQHRAALRRARGRAALGSAEVGRGADVGAILHACTRARGAGGHMRWGGGSGGVAPRAHFLLATSARTSCLRQARGAGCAPGR